MGKKNGGKPIKICMLGKFSISMGDNLLTQKLGRTNRVWTLIEYIAANRHKAITIDALMDAVWEDDTETIDQPVNALKNLVYRARMELNKLSPQPVDCILYFYERSAYAWNNDLPCEVDVEEFEECCAVVDDAQEPIERRIQMGLRAGELYQGEFLPATSHRMWVITRASSCAAMYKRAVLTTFELLLEKQRYQDAVQLCQRGAEFAPFEEEIHHALCRAYAFYGDSASAIKHYYFTSDLFYKEFGADLSKEFKAFYLQVLKENSRTEMDLSIIKADLREGDGRNGAFFCEYEIFRHVYRVQARSMLRSGISICVALLSLCSKSDGKALEKGEPRVLNCLKETIRESLRKGDVYTLYSATQFLIMLPGTSLENANMVSSRIERTCMDKLGKREFKHIARDFNLVAKAAAVEAADLILMENEKE